MKPLILVINAGSSSIKWALFQKTRLLSKGSIEPSISKLIKTLRQFTSLPINAIGHRITHGGDKPAFLTKSAIKHIEKYIDFAPLHLPLNIALVKATEKLFPDTPQIGCFDTYFHKDLPKLQKLLPLDQDCYKKGIYKYGFHGLSYEYIVSKLPKSEKKRCIIAHLGSGSSLAAIRNGKGIDTTMTLSPTGGLMMSTRPGDLDPEVILFLLKKRKNSETVRDFLNHKCGLLGISGVSGNMQKLLLSKKPSAKEAIDLYTLIVAKEISALATSLKGVETLIFTGGIGENCPKIRREIIKHLSFLNISSIHVITTDEESVIAKHVTKLIAKY